jgi:tetratricopeptide (TPR) repeat protein
MKCHLASILALFSAVAATPACSFSYGTRVRDDAAILERERDPERLLAAGDAWASVGDSARAAQYYELAVACGAPEARVFPKLLVALIRDKQYRGATIATESHLRLHPADVPARLVLASLYASFGDGPSARKEYESILRKEPDNPDAHYALAMILRGEQGDPLAADRHFREYLRVAPEGPHAEQARGLLLESVQ